MKDFIAALLRIFTGSTGNGQEVRLNEQLIWMNAQKLYWVLSLGVQLAVFKKGCIGGETTYCNIFASEILDSRCSRVWTVKVREGELLKTEYDMGGEIDAYDYDITPIMRDHDVNNLLNSPIPLAYAQAVEAANQGRIRFLTAQQAQNKANTGTPIMVLSKEFNHVAVVAPNFVRQNRAWVLLPYDDTKGCYTGNAGATNGMMYMSDPRGFGGVNWRSPEILYIEFPRYDGQFDE